MKNIIIAILIFLLFSSVILAATFILDLEPGDDAVVSCNGEIDLTGQTSSQITADCNPPPTATPMPTTTPTPAPPSGNLLVNPEFGNAFDGVDYYCTLEIESVQPGWDSQYAMSRAPWGDSPTESQCAMKMARLGVGPGHADVIPPGETGYVEQVVPVSGTFNQIEFFVWHSEHEEGDVWYSIEASSDGVNFVTAVETDPTLHRVVQLSEKSVCDIFEGRVSVQADGSAIWSVNPVDPANCPSPDPADIIFTAPGFSGNITHIKVGFYNKPAASGQSGVKAAKAGLTVN